MAAISVSLSVDRCLDDFKKLIASATAVGYAVGDQTNLKISTGQTNGCLGEVKQPEGYHKIIVTQMEQIPCPALLPEYRITVDNPPLTGIIDLVKTSLYGDIIIEYKTGAPRIEHQYQCTFYAVLWWLFTGRSISGYNILYAAHAPVLMQSMSYEKMQKEVTRLADAIEQCRSEIGRDLPIAKPNTDYCRHCSVRQLCSEYWSCKETSDSRWTNAAIADLLDDTQKSSWRDIEIILENATWSGNSFSVVMALPHRVGRPKMVTLICQVPVRFYPTNPAIQRRIRLLGVGIHYRDGVLKVVYSGFTEAFWCASCS